MRPKDYGFGRVVVWFSCGAASACAAKLAVQKYGEKVAVVYCDTMKTEHPDNARFFGEVEKWLGVKIEKIKSYKFEDVDEVFEKTRYMSGIKGARCTSEMKKVPRFEFQEWNDLHIFGLCADEERRIRLFENNNPELILEWNLKESGLRKDDCYQILKDAGIDLPVMYSLGFKNNNCIGCVKATSPKYWDRVRKHFPDVYQRRCRQSRFLGVRLVQYHGVRIFLDELPDPIRDKREEEDIECGPVCVGLENQNDRSELPILQRS